jgi:iron complex outermembrane receptor protein
MRGLITCSGQRWMLAVLMRLALLLPLGSVRAQDASSAAMQDADAGVEEPDLDSQAHAAPALPPIAAPAVRATQAPPPAADPQDMSYGAIAVAPGPFASIELDKVPRNVQQLDTAWLAEQHGVGLHEALNARLGSATINDVQSNPLQPDFQYRGFTASPLLGTPQGLAVYQNGVRINEPFGDLLQWDLIPSFALAAVQLIPGANPVYGLNALGGSLVLRMKDGFRAPGYRVEGLAGSFSRYRATAEYGRASEHWALYAGASAFGEQGFRDKSQSSAQNFYADLRHRSARHEVGLSATLASTDLNGNGPAPIELLRRDRSAVYTWPDNTRNALLMLNLDVKQQLSARVALQGLAYVRHGRRKTLNGDAAQFDLCAANGGESLLCDEAGNTLRDESGREIAVREPFDALFNTTDTLTDGQGASLQLNLQEPVFSGANQFVLGVSYDAAHSAFLQHAELGRLTPDRSVQAADVSLAGAGFQTDLDVQNHQLGAYASDTWTPLTPLSINLSARANWFNTALDDRLGRALDGRHSFARVNPALGLTYRIHRELTLFAGYGESNRAPSASELACADPNQPCRVPNAFIGDPPLKQVVSRSAELGLRARFGVRSRPWLEGSIAGFGARNQDDILFVAGSRVGTGYFQNAGATQRVGMEVSLAHQTGPLRAYASYALLRATFESELRLPGGANPSAMDDPMNGPTIEVHPGSRIPGLPAHVVKAGITLRPIDALEFGVSMLGQGSQPFRGDEANALPPVRGYVILNAHASYQLWTQLQLFVRAQNLLDTRYDTFGVLANPTEVLPGSSDPRFLGRGAPFGMWFGAVLADAL